MSCFIWHFGDLNEEIVIGVLKYGHLCNKKHPTIDNSLNINHGYLQSTYLLALDISYAEVLCFIIFETSCYIFPSFFFVIFATYFHPILDAKFLMR